jgi:hypothetical protein
MLRSKPATPRRWSSHDGIHGRKQGAGATRLSDRTKREQIDFQVKPRINLLLNMSGRIRPRCPKMGERALRGPGNDE